MKAFGIKNRVVWVAALGLALTSAIAAGPGGNNDRHDNPPPAPKAPEPPRQPDIPRGPEPQREQTPPPAPRAPEPQRQPDIPRGPITPPAPAPAAPEPAPKQQDAPRQPAIPRGPINPHEDKPTTPAPTQSWIPRGPIAPPAPSQQPTPKPNQDGSQHYHFQGGQGQQNQQNQNNPNSRNQQQGNWFDRYNRQTSNGTGRSGQVTYQGNNNQYQSQGQRPPRLGPPPVLHTTGSELQYLRRQHDFRYVYGPSGRVGYWGYSARWRDAFFSYPFYIFDPYQTFGFISPWYYYANLPGYIDPDRCLVVGPNMLPKTFVGTEYTYSGYTQQDVDSAYQAGYQQGQNDVRAGNRILNGALDDIVSVFQNADQRALDRLVPDSGNVNIYVEGQYSYSLSANDFYDLIKDNSQTTHTVSYQILDVRTNGNEVKVLALHTFVDPWGQNQSVYHTYLLNVGNRGAQIMEYGTSSTRPW